MIRIGQGYDIHKLILKQHNNLKLANFIIPNINYKIIATSDGDVILHAIADSLLGAVGDYDIGHYFPKDKNLNNKSIDILLFAINRINQKNYVINNIDITIVCDLVYFDSYIEKMKLSLAKLLNLNILNIGIKAKSSKNLFINYLQVTAISLIRTNNKL